MSNIKKNQHLVMPEERAFIKWMVKEKYNLTPFDQDVLEMVKRAFLAGIKYERNIWTGD